MPIFGDTDDLARGDAETLAPLSQERVTSTLDSLEINYGTDDEGDVVAGFEGNPCWFRTVGPGNETLAFSFNARWRAWLDGEQLAAALAAVNEWNATQVFPRALCVQDEQGELVLGADYTHDYEFGVTDLQLRNDVTIAVTQAMRYFEFLEERFPGAVEASYQQSKEEAEAEAERAEEVDAEVGTTDAGESDDVDDAKLTEETDEPKDDEGR